MRAVMTEMREVRDHHSLTWSPTVVTWYAMFNIAATSRRAALNAIKVEVDRLLKEEET